MKLRILALWENLRSSYWFVPTLMAIAATILAYVLVALDNAIPSEIVQKLRWLYGGGAEGARSVLSTIAGSVVTVAGTTFSITIAALTLASSQFGPRLLRTFRRDTGNQIVLGTFISTFLYCLLVLRKIRGTDQRQFVPDVAVTTGVLLAVLSLAVLIYFIHHTASSIQVSNLMTSVERELNLTIRFVFPARDEFSKLEREIGAHADVAPPPDDSALIQTGKGGYLQRVDYEALVNYAARRDCRIFVHMRPGNVSLSDIPLATVTPASCADEDEESSLHGAFYFGKERTPEQDPEYAILQLTEISVRALSPGINDPFTAIAGLDKITESMALIAQRRMVSTLLYDEKSTLRVVATPFHYDDLVIAAYQYIRKAAANNREVLSHISECLKMLVVRADDRNFHSALENQLQLTEADILKCEP